MGRAAVAAVAAVLLAVPAGAVQASSRTQAGFEHIASYDVEITVEPSGSILVKEVIDYDFGAQEKHGIFRDIPVRLRYDDRYDRVYPLRDLAVEGSPGTPDDVKTENQGANTHIRIGDPDKTITGRHAYTIRYRIEGALNGFSEHDELYWNAIGTEWTVPINQATVTVTAPGSITEVACFSGPKDSRLGCSSSGYAGSIARFSHSRLASHEGLTVVVALPKGLVPNPVPVLDERWALDRAFEVTPLTLGASLALLGAVIAGLWALVWRRGRDRRWIGSPVDVAFGGVAGEEAVPLMERPIIPVEFEPPDRLLPGQVGTLVDEVANPLDVTATIVDLAVRGYLRIEEIPKKGWFGKADWNLVKLKPGEELRQYERLLIDSLFRSGDEVKLSELRNTFAARLQQVQDSLYHDVVEQGWFATRPDRVRTLWRAIGIVAVVVGIGAVVVAAAFTRLGLIPIPLLVGGVMMLVLAGRMPRRTAKGTGTLRRVQGFRRFIEESEKERARFAEQQNLFSEYLPFAIVFGATEKWARAFEGLDAQIEPTWYVGGHPFTTAGFSDSIDGFAVSTSGTIASTPSGSGSSGFSGGSSGGGGGGGGGGSW